MVTRKAIEQRIIGLVKDLKEAGIQADKVVLFGSYAKGKATDNSDIDLAIWSEQFTGTRSLDIENIASIISKYPLIELHTFNSRENSNPFSNEIIQSGMDYSQLKV